MIFRQMVFMLVTAGEYSKLQIATSLSEIPQVQETHPIDLLQVDQIPSDLHEHDKNNPYNEQI
jgi:hypothetical protein